MKRAQREGGREGVRVLLTLVHLEMALSQESFEVNSEIHPTHLLPVGVDALQRCRLRGRRQGPAAAELLGEKLHAVGVQIRKAQGLGGLVAAQVVETKERGVDSKGKREAAKGDTLSQVIGGNGGESLGPPEERDAEGQGEDGGSLP